MFVRMLKLPEEQRRLHDLSSLRIAIHAAAPCPVPVKQQMIDWWGPIVWEYYAGTEGMGMTLVDSADWLAHKGTVGRAVVGVLRICDDDRRGTAGRRDRRRVLLRRQDLRVPQRSSRRPLPAATPRAGRRSATSATWMPKGIST